MPAGGRGEGVGREGEEVFADKEAVPFGKLCPRFGAELGLGVGGDDAAGIFVCRDRPEDEPCDECAFADAVSAGDGFADGRAFFEAVADRTEGVGLPLFGALFLGEVA